MTPEEVLAAIPQQPPFRFVDEILELGDEHIVAAVTFPPEADFYRGHFPGHPITPGVILVEAMAQAGVVALGIHRLARDVGPDEVGKYTTFLTEAEVEFNEVVEPGARILTTGRIVFFRRRKMRCSVEARREDGTLVCSGTLAGMGVPR